MMSYRSLALWLLLISPVLTSWAQGSSPANRPKSSSAARPDSVTLTMTAAGNFAVPAVINHEDTVLLMVHTAESGVTLTEDATKRLHSLHFSGADSVESWGGKGNTSRYSQNNSMQMGTLAWDKLLVWEDINSGKGTDGKFGLDLFKGKTVEVDFNKGLLFVNANLADTIGYERHALKVQRTNMFIEATCVVGDSTYSNWYLIHTGYAGSLLLDDTFVNTHSLDTKLHITEEKELKDSYGHVLKVQKAILPSFMLGKAVLKDVSVGFFHGAIGRQKMSILGADVLKRFNFILSGDRNWIYLKPNGTS